MIELVAQPKFCVGCRHYQEQSSTCGYVRDTLSLVTGKTTRIVSFDAAFEREKDTYYSIELCGPSGRHWETR